MWRFAEQEENNVFDDAGIGSMKKLHGCANFLHSSQRSAPQAEKQLTQRQQIVLLHFNQHHIGNKDDALNSLKTTGFYVI